MHALESGSVALVVERDPRFAVAIEDHLTRGGWRVVHVETGREALRLCDDVRAQVVLAELDGAQDGLELAALLARTAAAPAVVLWSARPSAALLPAATMERLRVDAILSRPCRLDVLARALVAARRRHAAREERRSAELLVPAPVAAAAR